MNKSVAILTLLIISALWGAQYPVIKYLVQSGLSPSEITFYRIIIGFLALALYMLWKKEKFPTTLKFWVLSASLGLCGDFFAQYLIALGQQTITAGFSSILIATSPFFTFLIPYFIPGQHLKKPHTTQLISLFFGLIGIVLLSYKQLQMSTHIFAIACLVGASLMFAIVNIIAEYARDYSGLSMSTASVFIMSMTLLPMNYHNLFSFDTISIPAISGILFLAIFCTAISFILMLFLAQGTNAVYLSYSNFLVPVFGVLFAVLLIHETIQPEMIISILFIFLGIVLLNFKKSRNKQIYD
ncbi:DMT family transporter [Celerinatantimonas sp. YJH-8]|uniref:DMT family transporter n=1 Tax=Celerinatantimonas sp. YJH-8 TaxID=3228714 RepID=UPI0038C35629